MSRFSALAKSTTIQRLLTKLAYHMANSTAWYHQFLIRDFLNRYDVNMSEAERENAQDYQSFNDFFTRSLKPGMRPIDQQATWVSPADGSVSSCGAIHQGQIFQAKGKKFTAQALLGGDAKLAQNFQNGNYATVYLSPKDYHRVHMPIDGRLVKMTYIPGALFSVSHATAQSVDALFARNERVVALFETKNGLLAMVLVGATIVGSISTTWHGVVNAHHGKKIKHWSYEQAPITIKQGEEMGRFLLGSTVVMLMDNPNVEFSPACIPLSSIRMGQALANSSLSP